MLVAIKGVKGQSGRPDFTRNGSGMPQEAMESERDTVQKPPLIFKYYPLSDLYKPFQDLDTTRNNVHLSDPYYQQDFIGGTLGPDLSAGYSFRYQGGAEGLRLGQEVHPILNGNLPETRFVQTNRPFFVVNYGTAQAVQGNTIQAIRGDDFSMEFYKSFAQNISLNFSYQSHTDKRASNDNNVSFKQLALNLFQKSKDGSRKSYIVYDNPRYSDGYLQSFENISSSIGTIENVRRKLTFGNSMIFRDSSSQDAILPRWDSQLEFGKEAYRINDPTVQSQERALFPYNVNGQEISTLSYQNEISKIVLSNSYSAELLGGEAKGSIDISRYSWTGLDTFGTSLIPILVKGSYFKKVSSYLNYSINGRIGILEANGDLGIESMASYYLGRNRLKAGITLERLLPTLAQRGIFLNDDNAQLFTNNFNPVTHISLYAAMIIPDLNGNVKVSADQYADLILPGLSGQFEQEARSTNVIAIEATSKIRLGPFQTEHRIIYQYIDNPNLVRPEIQYYGKLFFEMNLFKKRMISQWGVDAYFTPSFETPTFWPVLGAFGPNANPSLSGHLLIVNPYLNLQVDKFYFFVKAVNVLDLIPSTSDKYWAASYPFSSSRIRFGVRWRLLD